MPSIRRRLDRAVRRLEDLLGFHPWMLALAVFLACAMGIAVMEGLRQRPPVVAEATTVSHR